MTTTTTTTTASTSVTRVVQIFFLDEREYEGLPYTLFHRDNGRVIGINSADNSQTTFVVTMTRVDLRPEPTHSRTDNVTTGISTLTGTSGRHKHPNRTVDNTIDATTITQGPATFMFTGTRYGADHTLINQCSLNGTVAAACNLTHVGSAWYNTKDAASSWNGTYSTYSYNWTSGDRYGFAPVTITQGAEMIATDASNPTSSGVANAGGRVRVDNASWLPLGVGMGGLVLSVILMAL
ncbi:hypothetical protein QBC46DRAFT_267923 [Diplogelasinospora grovesii]|uniref:Uncharacterized protein n=1 Tax=Diplogelasinospora grovesii TaxID=303347 RepID=A0AAN6S1P8_9PEZI|nr:hypothetical protein QBC46DRAFT_267923 [Diplogelasinospora grovesii]